MPNGRSTYAADPANASLLADVARWFGDEAGEAPSEEPVDVLLSTAAPDRPARHVVITGALDETVDAWDAEVAPQTVAGVLWAPNDAADGGVDAIVAWLALRTQTPATPLSDLVDANQRALRWSVAAGRRVALADDVPIDVDDAEIRQWLDEQPSVRELGLAVDRIGGDSADATLTSTDRFRQALDGLDTLAELPRPEFTELDSALAEHLRQVQRSGFGRWRAGRARAQSQDALSTAARTLAADRLRALIEVRREQVLTARRTEQTVHRAEAATDAIARCVVDLQLPAAVDFAKVPRSWPGEPAPPRRYVLVDPDVAAAIPQVSGATVRTCEHVPPDYALCVVVQSGFSLPGLR